MTFADLLFVDSGGYEISADLDLSDQRTMTHIASPKKWLVADHQNSLNKMAFDRPIVLVNYDNPNRRQSFEVQLARAKKFFLNYPMAENGNTCKGRTSSNSRISKKLRKH